MLRVGFMWCKNCGWLPWVLTPLILKCRNFSMGLTDKSVETQRLLNEFWKEG